MRAVVTGCAGFIGSHLTQQLINDGFHVVGVDGFTDNYSALDKFANLETLVREPRFELIPTCIDKCDLAKLFVDKPVIIHLAARPGVRTSFGDGFTDYVRENILATQQLFEAALATGCSRVVYASSSSVYGDADTYPCFEDSTPPRPRSPYGVTKQTCEGLAKVYAQMGLGSVGLRYFTVYGPRQRPDMAMRKLCEAAIGGPEFTLHGDGGQSRDFTYVDDVVDATIRAALAPTVPLLLNIGGGYEATMTEVIETLTDLHGANIPVLGGDVVPGDVRRTGGDTTAARTALRWTPKVSLRDGLAHELHWVRERAERMSTSTRRTTLTQATA